MRKYTETEITHRNQTILLSTLSVLLDLARWHTKNNP